MEGLFIMEGICTNLDLSRPFYQVLLERTEGNERKRYFWSSNMSIDSERPSGYVIPENTYITSVRVRSNFQPYVNECEIELSNISGHSPDIAAGDDIRVFLGYYRKDQPLRPDFAKVFTGEISEIERGFNGSRVIAASKVSKLLSLRRNIVINRDTIDNIIKKLLAEAEYIKINEISSSDIQKSRYIFSDSENLFEIIRELCIEGGMDLYMDVHDKLIAKVWEPEEPIPGEQGLEKIYPDTHDENDTRQHIHNFYFGLNIIDMRVEYRGSGIGSLEIRSFSPYGEENERQYSIDRTASIKNSDEPHIPSSRNEVVYLPFTPPESAEKIAENLIRYHNPRLTGTLTVVGSPHVRLNDGIRTAGKLFGKDPLADISSSGSRWDATYNDTRATEDEGGGKIFQVAGVDHILNFTDGFRSIFKLEEREPLEHGDEEAGDRTGEERSMEETTKEREEVPSGESKIAPEYPMVADREACSLISAKDEFRRKLDQLRDLGMGIESEPPDNAE